MDDWEGLVTALQDVVGVALRHSEGKVTIYNIYNDCNNTAALQALTGAIQTTGNDRDESGIRSSMIWLGNFNSHHPMWDNEANNHLFTQAGLNRTQELINLLDECNMCMVLPAGIPTLHAKNTKNYTCTDNVFASAHLEERVTHCRMEPEKRPICTDHMPITGKVELKVHRSASAKRKNFCRTNWEEFHRKLGEKLSTLPTPTRIKDICDFEQRIDNFESMLHEVIMELVPENKDLPHTK